MDPRRSFSVLDLPMDASPEQARQAYRDLMSVWHPDRHAHSPRLQQKAEDKVKEINAAYDAIRAFLAERPPKGQAFGTGASPEKKTGNKKNNAKDEKKNLRGKEGKTDWRRTEAILASLKRARERADARNAEQIREERQARQRAEAEQAAKKRADAERARRLRTERQRAKEQKAREAERIRVQNWEITEARLKKILEQKQGENPSVDTVTPTPRANPAPLVRTLLQWTVYTLALTLCFSINIVQDHYRFDVFAILGLCILAVAACRLVLAHLKKKSRP